MKIKNKKSGKVIDVPEGVWNRMTQDGTAKRYEEAKVEVEERPLETNLLTLQQRRDMMDDMREHGVIVGGNIKDETLKNRYNNFLQTKTFEEEDGTD